MSFSSHFLDEVRARIGIAGVVGKQVGLKRAGRELMGLCPFHKEKSPSFTVSEEKGFYHCFGCGAHGSVFDFIMETENLSFPEAVERLAAEAGMEVPVSSPEEREQATRAKSLYSVMDAAAAFFEKQLHLPSGKTALDYLYNRGLSETTIARFRLGFAPDSRGALKSEMTREEFTDEQLIEGGLVIQPEEGDRASYDRFRGRIMFPIADARGRIIAFGGRILDDSPTRPGGRPPAKYLNSPETPLFHKGRNLYGLAQAREHAVKAETIVVTEGYTDVIALHQAGIEHAVAPLGTALTEQQIALLWRVVPQPVLCFDGDGAGERAALRAAERALPMLVPGHSLRFVALPQGEDPDSLVKSQGADAMEVLLGNALPLHELLWRAESTGHKLESPDDRAALEKRLNDQAAKIQDETVRRYYRDAFRNKLREAFQPKFQNSNYRGKWSPPRRTQQMAEKSGAATRIDDSQIREGILLATLITHPELFDLIGERLGEIGLSTPELDVLRQETLKTLSSRPGLDFPALEVHLCETGFSQHLSGLLSRHVFEHARFARPEEPFETAHAGWEQMFQLYLSSQLVVEIQEAEKRLADDPSEEALRTLVVLKEQLESATAGEL